MKTYVSKDIRNVCFAGAQGDGKTSLAEALLFNAGASSRLGKVDDGTTVVDYSEEEIARKISVGLNVAFIEHKDSKINLLVAPGYPDFIGDVHAAAAVAESCIFTASADTGINPIGDNIWEYLEEKKLPVAIFLNKVDKENVDFSATVKALREKLGPQVVALSVPDAGGGKFTRVINLLDPSVPETFKEWKEAMIETVSSADDKLTEEYLEGKEITPQELAATLRSAIRERKIFPVLCGSALKNIGVRELADFIADYLPSPQVDESNKHFSALVYKTVSEPGMGHLNFAKVCSGSVQAGSDAHNFTRQTRERVGQLCFVQGKKKTDTASANAGDLVAIMKLKDTRTNDVLGEEKNAPSIPQIVFPDTIYDRAIVTQSKGDDEKVGNALAVLTLESPTIKHHFNPETRQMIVSGMGSLQLEVMVHRIKARYGVTVELHPPRVPYKETVHGKCEVQGKYKRQTGGHGQYGDCWLRIEPLERGKGFEFVDKVVGGAIPRNFIPAVEKGVREAMDQGVIAGYPVVDLRVTVYDGSYHDVDSSDMAFKIAAAMALRKGMNDARPCLLEPIMNLDVVVPSEYMGAVMGDLNSKRGRVLGMDKSGKKELIKAQAPLGDIFQYATDLRSLTKGSGKFMMKLSHYEDAPPQIAQPLIELYQKSKAPENDK